MSGSLSGRVAAVTGGARGIGDAIAARLLAEGAEVFALDKMIRQSRAKASPISHPAQTSGRFSLQMICRRGA
jgi:NAD(P)-dependent dehydrogenase (short-subunit alcohol dehydrogenase family)